MAQIKTNLQYGVTGSLQTASYTSLDATKLSGNLPAISGASLTGITTGITEADQWRLTTTFSSNASPISSNLERNDTSGFGLLGTGMTQSSGIFTFPSTGYWLIRFVVWGGSEAHTQGVGNSIQVTTNNSSYVQATWVNQGIYNFGSSLVSGASVFTEYMFDVTSTTNCKVRFHFGAGQGGEVCQGHGSYNHTHMTFMKMADT